jgi:hypothetical protein
MTACVSGNGFLVGIELNKMGFGYFMALESLDLRKINELILICISTELDDISSFVLYLIYEAHNFKFGSDMLSMILGRRDSGQE